MVFMTTQAIGLAMRLKRQAELLITLITAATELDIRPPSDNLMLTSAIILSIVVPMQISMTNPKFEPFIVKATINTAVLIGLPASKAARKYALKSQKTDFLMTEAHLAPEPVEWRRLYFRKLFS